MSLLETFLTSLENKGSGSHGVHAVFLIRYHCYRNHSIRALCKKKSVGVDTCSQVFFKEMFTGT